MSQATSGTTFPIHPVSDAAATSVATRQEIQAAAEHGMYANAEHDACGSAIRVDAVSGDAAIDQAWVLLKQRHPGEYIVVTAAIRK